MFGRKPAVDGSAGPSGSNNSTTPPVKKGLGGFFGTTRSPATSHSNSIGKPSTPTRPELKDDDLSGMFTRASTLLENITRRVGSGRNADAKTATDDDSRQFMRVNEVKRLTTRIRSGVEKLMDSSERAAWEQQLQFLDTETASAVDAVLLAASPTPERNAESKSNECKTPSELNKSETNGGGDMFAGLNVTPTPSMTKPATQLQSPTTQNANPVPWNDRASSQTVLSTPPDGLNLFSGLDVSPSPLVKIAPTTLNTPGLKTQELSTGISLAPPPPPLDVGMFTESTAGETIRDEAPLGIQTSPEKVDDVQNETAENSPLRRPRVRVGYAREPEEGTVGPSKAEVEAKFQAEVQARAEAEGNAKAEADAKARELQARADAVARAEAEATAAALEAQAEAAKKEAELTEKRQEALVVKRWQAAVTIQSHHRGRQGRLMLSKMQAAMAHSAATAAGDALGRAKHQSKAATRIQATYRARAARAEVAKMHSNTKAAAAAAAAAEAEVRAAKSAELAAAAAEEAALAEADEHRAQERAALTIQANLQGRTARLEVTKRKVAEVTARDAGKHADAEEAQAREAAAVRIQAAHRGKVARANLIKRKVTLVEARDDADGAVEKSLNKHKLARETFVNHSNIVNGISSEEEDGTGDTGDNTTGDETIPRTNVSETSPMDDACAMTCAVATTSMQVCLDKFRGVFGTKEDVKSLADHLETVSRNASAAAVEARRCAGEELGTQEVTNIPVNIPSTNTADPLAAASFNLMSF